MKLRYRTLISSALLTGLILHTPTVKAGSPTGLVNLATSPLANSSTTVVKPNIMFTLDDSGSMDSDYLPDWANSSAAYLKANARYNGVAYDPGILYVPPAYFDANGALNTTTYPSQTGTSTATGANTANSLPNWGKVKQDAFGVQTSSLSDLNNAAYYFTFTAGEYCTTSDLKTCTNLTTPNSTYPYAAYVRWCNASNSSDCRALYSSGTYKNIRHPAQGGSTSALTITVTNNQTATLAGITANGQQIMNSAASFYDNRNNFAQAITDSINACTYAIPSGSNCTTLGYKATRNNGVVTIETPYRGITTFGPVLGSRTNTSISISPSNFSAPSVAGTDQIAPILSSISVYNYPGTSAKHVNRTDCAGTSCTYAEEMTNYANWYTYYRTRMQAMKTSVSRAFKVLDQRYRVGFNTILYTGVNSTDQRFLDVDTFELAHKNNWYVKLFKANPDGFTPLRGAISKVGRYYANKITNQKDPLQYSCQQNFSILSTDGYWNTNSESSSYGPFKITTNTTVGNLDGAGTPLPQYEGVTASNTLADVAKYYYDTDLRSIALGNCSGRLGTDVCEDNVFLSNTDSNSKQHVTQFTMGLGIDGTLVYQDDYLTATSGDYYDLKKGLNSKQWPNPITNTNEERIDDLWHAAVNGRGTYFSAKDPDSIVRGFTNALNSIAAKSGAGAAAATSTLNPVAGDNTAYVASYTTVKWQGNLEARPISISTGEVSETASWCAESIIPNSCASPGTIETDNSTTPLSYNCVTPNATSCPGGTLRPDSSCAIPIAASCTGTMAAKVAPTADTRTIYKANAVGNLLESFTYANLSTNQKQFFNTPYLTGKLSQLNAYSAAEATLALGENLVKFIRGQTGYEDRGINTTAGRPSLYRFRETVLADITESQPVFVGKPFFHYADTDYSAFVNAKAARAKTVFVGANDGMLHAFNADTGEERWAFVPTAVIPNLWALADSQYSAKHQNYVNGAPVIGDVYDSVANEWKTILVGGLSGGGRSYYALDVTDPATPKLLWELNSTNIPNLGYSYGSPKITKNQAGLWVVMLTSGYNNVSPGDGGGYLFIRNAITGVEIKTMPTGVGSTTIPSGLSRFTVWADDGDIDNTGKFAYGGDLMGNVWRFTPDSADTQGMQFAVLKDNSNAGTAKTQPITAAPELGLIKGKRIIFVGTGKYLETSDLSDTQLESIYAIKDDDVTTTFVNPRTVLVQQTLTEDSSGSYRTSTSKPVDFITGNGWFVDFPDPGERVHVNPQLDSGTLFVPTTVPSNTACSPGGTGWFNYFDYRTGSAVKGADGNYVSQKTNAPIVGFNVFYLPTGKRVVGIVTADGPTPKPPAKDVGQGDGRGDFGGLNVMWREIVP